MRKARTIALTAGAGALSAAIVAAMATAAPAATTAAAKPATPAIHVKPGVKVLAQGKALSTPWTTALCEANLHIACWGPDQVRAAYNEAPLFKAGITGKGSTIVIVDSFGSPTIKNDLHVFDTQFGYPDPPSLKVITPAGPIPAWDPNNGDMTGWAGETTLDVEYAHTIAPGANIVLVETPDAETEGVTGFPNIVKSELAVLDHPERFGIKGKVTVISQSFGATEETFTSFKQLAPLRAAYIDAARKGVSVLASTGDDGAANAMLNGSDLYTTPVTAWPATDPLVTAVGGTQIKQNAAGKYSQVVWNDTFDVPLQQAFTGTDGPNPFSTGGGVSEFFRRPAYQAGVARTIASAVGKNNDRALPRAVPDISMSGACDGAVTVYYSFPGGATGWHLVCGTSESAPLFSGIVALAAQVAHHSLGLVNPRLYALLARHAPGLVDVTSGNNTVAFAQGNPAQNFTVHGYSAKRGYDLASGVGTLNAALFVPELAGSSHW
jgi:subtilase family serine protease